MRVVLASAVSLVALLGVTEQAAACSCAGPERPPSLRGQDAAVTARLLRVERSPGAGDAVYTYKVRRVFKGRREYGLHHGFRLHIESSTSGSTCGLPNGPGRVYGLILYEDRHELQANLCTVVTRKWLRKAARNRNPERLTSTRSSLPGAYSAQRGTITLAPPRAPARIVARRWEERAAATYGL